MAKVVVLGSGTSNGVPMLGVEYPLGYLAEPKNHRTRSSIVILGPQGNVLVDCTPELRIQLVRENIYDVDSVLITHTHADHVMGMDDLRSFCLKYRRPMKIYTANVYHEDIRRIFPYAFIDSKPGINLPQFELMDCPEVLHLAGLEIQTMWVEHGPLPCMGIRVNDFAYLTDVSAIPEDAMKKLRGLDVLILDAVRYKPHPNHFHYDKAIEVAQELGAKLTYFTHLSHDYDHDITEAALPEGIRLAYDGLRISI